MRRRARKVEKVIERRSEESDAERIGEGGGSRVGDQEEEGDGGKGTREERKNMHSRRRRSRRQRRRMGRR